MGSSSEQDQQVAASAMTSRTGQPAVLSEPKVRRATEALPPPCRCPRSYGTTEHLPGGPPPTVSSEPPISSLQLDWNLEAVARRRRGGPVCSMASRLAAACRSDCC